MSETITQARTELDAAIIAGHIGPVQVAAERYAAAAAAEIARLRGLVRGFTGEIAEHCDGEFSEEEMAMIGIGIALGRQAEPDHPCKRCGGAGWWWEDTPDGDYDTMLRECDHKPIEEGA